MSDAILGSQIRAAVETMSTRTSAHSMAQFGLSFRFCALLTFVAASPLAHGFAARRVSTPVENLLHTWTKEGISFAKEGSAPSNVSVGRLQLDALRPADWHIPNSSSGLVYPPAKLYFCQIPKVASLQVNKLFNELNHISPDEADGGNHPAFRASSAPRLGLHDNEISLETGWSFAYFQRDPLERFLSAFLSKCMFSERRGMVEDDGAHCHGEPIKAPVDTSTAVAAFERHVAQFYDRFYKKAVGVVIDDGHWQSQREHLRHCRLRINQTVYVGNLTDPADVHRQLLEMFARVGVHEAAPVVERLFPIKKVAGHVSNTRDMMAKFYRYPETVKMVAFMYRQDYMQLRMPFPDILREALGSSSPDTLGGLTIESLKPPPGSITP